MDHSHAGHRHDNMPSEGGATDPVCGMTVDIKPAKHTTAYKSQSYYFAAKAAKRSLRLPLQSILMLPPKCRSRLLRARFIRAPCIRKFNKSVPAHARSAVWRWNPWW